MTVWYLAVAMSSGLVGWLVGWIMGWRRGRAIWRGYKQSMFDRLAENEKAILEAKMLYSYGVIDQSELETRVGHLHDWDGNP